MPPPPDRVIETVVRRLGAIPAAELRGQEHWKQIPDSASGRAAASAPRRRFAGFAISAMGFIAVGVVMVVALSGESSVNKAEAALPVFTRAATDATPTRGHTPALVQAGARYSDARKISTTNGPGYVMPASDGRICLAVPDKLEGYGEHCAGPEKVERGGLHVVLAGPREGAMAAVVPKTTSDAMLHLADGTDRKLDIIGGVITASATGNARVSYQVGGRRVSVSLNGYIRCVRIPQDTTMSRSDVRRAAERAGTKVCAGDARR